MLKKFLQRWKSSRRKVLVTILIGALAGAAVAGAVVYAKFSLHGRFAANTFIASTDISYLDSAESIALLEKAREDFLNTELELVFGTEVKTATYGELGVDIMVKETVSALTKMEGSEINALDLILSGTVKKEKLPAIVSVDRGMLEIKLNEFFALEEIAPVEASFTLDEKGNVLIEEGRGGELVDMDSVIAQIKNAGRWMSPSSLNITTKPVSPLLTIAELEAQKKEIEDALDQPLSLVDPVYSDNWDITLRDYPAWVNFVPKQNVSIPYFNTDISLSGKLDKALPGENIKMGIEINQEALDVYVDEKISKWLDRPAIDVNIYTEEGGSVAIEGRGSNGLKIQRGQLKKAIELAVENGIKDVPIPVMEILPKIEISQDLREKGIKERISVGHTSFYGSPVNRVHNIKTGASKFDGRLIAPGEVFSFNTDLGRVDASTGYRKELVIKPEGTIPEYGGGICQVSTTVFRTILLAGLPIVERNQHSYAVSYYSQILGHGLDATIYLGGADLKFMNDTEHHILIQTYTENDYELYIVFYGTDTGRKVELEGPYLSNYRKPGPTIHEESAELAPGETKQVEKAHTGFDALWYRHTTFPDGTVTTEPIKTNYKAVSAKILTGPPEL